MQRRIDVVGAAVVRAGEHTAAGVAHRKGVLPLIREEWHDELGQPVRRRAEYGARSPVRDHDRRPAQHVGLWDEALDSDVGRNRSDDCVVDM